jgi:hypothetical protein
MNRGVSFDAADYDREISRVASDHSWQTPERTAGRLILTGIDHKHLLSYGLASSWVCEELRNPGWFRVALRIGKDDQVFVDTPWLGRTPEKLAADVCATLAEPPDRWIATWLAVEPSLRTTSPAIAGSRSLPHTLDRPRST